VQLQGAVLLVVQLLQSSSISHLHDNAAPAQTRALAMCQAAAQHRTPCACMPADQVLLHVHRACKCVPCTHLPIWCCSRAILVTCSVYVHTKLQRTSLLLTLLEPVQDCGEAAHAVEQRLPPRGCLKYSRLLLPVLAEEGVTVLSSENIASALHDVG
jgi:hypothetical protein